MPWSCFSKFANRSIFGYKTHDNQIVHANVDVLKLKTTLKRRAEDSQGTIRDILDDKANSSRVGGQVSFVNLESTMYKRRRLNSQNIPRDAEETIFLFSNCGEEYTSYLAFIINEHVSEEIAAGFMSRKWFDTLQFDSETLIQADATLYVVPK